MALISVGGYIPESVCRRLVNYQYSSVGGYLPEALCRGLLTSGTV